MYALAVLSIIASIIHVNGIDPRIVGGKPAPAGKYPYQVSVKGTMTPGVYLICGGSIINNRYVLTAAHCVHKMDAKKYTITVGSIELFNAGDVYPVERLIWHPNYDEIVLANDIALIRVAKNITFKNTVQPIPFASKYDISTNDSGVITGWGKLVSNGPVSTKLQEINVTILSQSTCETIWQAKKTNVCTHMKVGQGACNGDSGGPLVVNNEQVGIASYVLVDCALGNPDVYTRVYSYKEWIERVMQNPSDPNVPADPNIPADPVISTTTKKSPNNGSGSYANTRTALLVVVSIIALHLHLSL